MKPSSITLALTLLCGSVCPGQSVRADDIDLFIGSSGGQAEAPNVVILIDNSTNWSRASQHWPDQPTQGQAEVNAIKSYIATVTTPLKMGLALLTDASTPYGGYLRFGVRDVSIAANRTALSNILTYIYNNINSPSEKIAVAHKDEVAGLYEVYKYFLGLAPYAGFKSKAALSDYSGNPNTYTGSGQGLNAGFALNSAGTQYNNPASSCSKQYLIYIANNASGSPSSPGQQVLESTNAGAALPPTAYNSWTDEWVRFLYQNGITTYILDAYYAQQNVQYSDSLKSAAAQAGPNNYYPVNSEAAITAAITKILTDIQSVNSTFAAASLPISATNRSVGQNQVFIGTFRPDGSASPRWFGNLKRYQLILDASGNPGLGDVTGTSAINSQTGFLADCALSYWTSDSSVYAPASGVTAEPYWSTLPFLLPFPISSCPSSQVPAQYIPTGVTWSPWSDLPDGPFVEKGGVAEVLRTGNIGSGNPTWQVNRTVKTLSGSSLVDFTAASSGLSSALTNYALGWDSSDENVNNYTDPTNAAGKKETRPSIHGDVIHSTPLPITYNSSADGVVLYYGTNDGMYRAVNALTGRELWAFVAPEFFSGFSRLSTNSPLIRYPQMPSTITPAPTPKDYFFDGSTGLYQNLDNSQIWIYPSMRRGGRMIYGFDVSPVNNNPPSTPGFKWKAGCPNLSNDTGCTTGMSGIGQTWSTPTPAFIQGYSSTVPVVVIGGGYDSTSTTVNGVTYRSCDDVDVSSPSCANRKGAVVYFIDANLGPNTLLRAVTLPSGQGGTPGSVIGDIAFTDVNNDGFVDYAYLSDSNGAIYRIDFVDGPVTLNPLTSNLWTAYKVAGTLGAGRKFLFAPAVLYNQGKVYIALGSGDREHPLSSNYPYTAPITNRFYVYVDDLSSTTSYTDLDGSSMIDYTSTTSCSTSAVLPGSTQQGWYMTLNQNGIGEQVVTPAIITSGQISFGTNRAIAPALGSCSTILGEARGYLVNLVNASGTIGVTGLCDGTRSSTYVGGGMPPPPRTSIVAVVNNGTTEYVQVCLGCPQKSGGVSTTLQPSNLELDAILTRRRTYWYTPTDN